MSDVGLDSELILDVTRALRAVDSLVEALRRGTTNVVVTADARAVTGAIDAAVLNADTRVDVTGEARQVTGAVDAAVDAADTGVEVTGEARQITGAIDAAVDAADTHAEVTADTAPAEREMRQLRHEVDRTSESTGRLRTLLAGLSIAAMARGIAEVVTAASDLNESGSKVRAVFGDLAVDLEKFAKGATSIGLTEQAALEATGTLGNLLTALGLSADAAVELAPEMVRLAADLASFNNLPIDVALEKLRSGLVGEIEPLRGIGISFNAAQVEAKAFELGIADASGELSEGAKVQARWALITEQSVNASGDFARTSDGLANQLRILQAEFGNVVAEAGQQLLPMVLELAGSVRSDLLPQFGELLENVLPPLIRILGVAAPAAGLLLEVLVAMSPVLEVVADVLEAIPEPLLGMAGGMLLAKSAFGGMDTLLGGIVPALRTLPDIFTGVASAVPRASSGVGALGGGLQGIAQKLATMNPLVAVGGLAVGALAARFVIAQQEERRFREEVEQATEALRNQDGQVRVTTEGIAAYVEGSSRFVDDDQIDDLHRLGLELEDVAEFVLAGEKGTQKFIQSAIAAGEVTEVWRDRAGDLRDAQGDLVEIGVGHTEVNGRIYAGNADLIRSYQELVKVEQEAAEQQVELLRVSGDLPQASIDAAVAANTAADGTVNWAGAMADLGAELDALNRKREAEQRHNEQVIAKYEELTKTYLGVAEALGRVDEAAPDVARLVRDIRLGAGDPQAFLDLALAIEEAGLKGEDLGDVAALLGVSIQDLEGFVGGTVEALDEFSSAAVGAMGGIGDAFKEMGDDGVLSAAELVTSLDQLTERMAAFRGNLQILADAGFSDIAAVIAQQGPEVGAALASELVTALEEGNLEVLESVRASTQAFNDEWSLTTDYLKNNLGPRFILESGLLGANASATFGGNLSFAERIRIAGALASSGLSQQGQAIAAIAAVEGARAARDYGAALGLDQVTIDEAIKAGVAIGANAPVDQAKTAGGDVGWAFGAGLNDGILGWSRAIRETAASVVGEAHYEARKKGEAWSPSRLFMRLGSDLGEGLAVGLDDTRGSVRASGRELVDVAAAELAALAESEARVHPMLAPSAVQVAPGATAAARQSSIASLIGSLTVVVEVDADTSPERARALGAAAGGGFIDAVEERRALIEARMA